MNGNLLSNCNASHYINNWNIIKNQRLNILHINIQSIRNKLDELSIYINEIEKKYKGTLHVIALSEIWIYKNENRFFNIEGYNAYFSNRENNRSGGCCIYVTDKLTSTMINECEYEKTNFLQIKINEFNMNIVCIYKYGVANIDNFNEKLERDILKSNRTIVIGDININLRNADYETRTYTDTMHSNGFICLNSTDEKYYTRKSNTINTLIDHAWTNLINNKFEISVIDTALSDHRLILVSYKPTEIETNEKRNNKREITVLDYGNIEKNITKLDKILGEDQFETLHSNLTEFMHENMKTLKNKNHKCKKPWVNRDMLNLMNLRDKYFTKIRKHGNNSNYTVKYEEIKMKIRQLKNYLKKKYYSKLIEKNINDSGKT